MRPHKYRNYDVSVQDTQDAPRETPGGPLKPNDSPIPRSARHSDPEFVPGRPHDGRTFPSTGSPAGTRPTVRMTS